MSQKKICLASDNWTPAHPLVIKAVVEANEGYAPSYGSDPWTEEAQKIIQEGFKSKCKVFIVPTGTGANVFALKLACRRYESIICTDIAHVQYQESGACESIVGCKLLTVPHQKGKLTCEAVLKKLRNERAFGKHSTSPRLLSITQPTEVGTVYSLAELKSLSKLCKEENLLLHIDGSRLYNAAVSLKIGLHEMVKSIHLDILSLGGTKNGLMGAEALLIFNSALHEGSDHLQKQTLQLVSKMRYLSAQYIPFFKNNLWHTLAAQSNQKAQEIASIIKAIPHLTLSYPVETNQLFFTAPSAWIPLIQEKIFCYPWDQEKNEVRFIASWNTSEEDITGVKSALSEIAKTEKANGRTQ
jgi:threonine aldolase